MLNFTGSSRRQRQVNLSGKPSSSGNYRAGKDTSSSSSTLAHAREHRAQREAARRQLNAALRVQRVFRGYRSRKERCAHFRRIWDSGNQFGLSKEDRGLSSSQDLSQSLSIFLLFWETRDPCDQRRLRHLISRINDEFFSFEGQGSCYINSDRLRILLFRFSKGVVLTSLASMKSLEDPRAGDVSQMLRLISILAQLIPEIVQSDYYSVLSSLVLHMLPDNPDQMYEDYHSMHLEAALGPLKKGSQADESLLSHFIFGYLSTPFLIQRLPSLKDPHNMKHIDLCSFSKLIKEGNLSSIDFNRRTWLLAHFIFLQRSQMNLKVSPDSASNKNNVSLEYVACLSKLVEYDCDEIATRWDIKNEDSSTFTGEPKHHSVNESKNGLDSKISRHKALPEFVKSELHQLQHQEFIKLLLSCVPTNENSSIKGWDSAGAYTVQIIAHMALILLTTFPNARQDLRKWFHLARTRDGSSPMDFFWKYIKGTSIFSNCTSTNSILTSLLEKSFSGIRTSQNDWIAILLFLEMFSFAGVVMDDEEFFSGKSTSLQILDLKKLSLFLKNLGFVTFWNENDIIKSFDYNLSDNPETAAHVASFAGIKCVSLSWARGTIVRLLRMLYHRDSRRRIFPVDHWLMTNEVDMQGFVPAVVAEEERRHEREMNEEDDEDEDNEMNLAAEADTDADQGRPSNLSNLSNLSNRQLNGTRERSRLSELASITPRLEILQNLPFFIPFSTRVEIFREFVLTDQRRRRHGYVDPDAWRWQMGHRQGGHTATDIISRHHGRIGRDSTLEDAYKAFYNLGEGLKEPIQITFVDSFGTEEAGIDGGGVTKEFLTSVTKEAFQSTKEDPDLDLDSQPDILRWQTLFVENDNHLLYPNSTILESVKAKYDSNHSSHFFEQYKYSLSSMEEETLDVLKRYEFLGRVLGKCLYEGILVEVRFAGFFMLKWSYGNEEVGVGFDDLKGLDETLWSSLQKLKYYNREILDDLSLTFSTEVSVPILDPDTMETRNKVETINLKPNGDMTLVTESNRLEFIYLLAKHKLVLQSRLQTNYFIRGLSSIISRKWLSMFNQAELQTLVGGDDLPIDIDDLRRNTTYGGVYTIGDTGEHPTILMFWQVMKELSDEEKRSVLKFVTSVSRAPLLGFGVLSPQFSIRDAGSDESRLPSTSTCVNLLKLPRYQSKGILKQKLLYAVNSGAGFDLS